MKIKLTPMRRRMAQGRVLLDHLWEKGARPQEALQSQHAPDCEHFSGCLLVASLFDWRGLSCKACPQEPPPEPTYEQD